MTSPTQRTLKLFRELGYTCAVTERWNSYAKLRQDLFQFIDVLALGNGRILGIQTTSTPNVSARRDKIDSLPEAEEWQNAGGLILVVGWSKKGPRGKRKLWEATIYQRCRVGEWRLWYETTWEASEKAS